jgi:DNA-binding SARP family transcriptional activator
MDFAVLGMLGVTVDSEPIPLGGRRQRATLAMLLSTANRPVSTGQLIEAVWWGQPPRTAADNLRLYIHRLRRLLGESRIVRSPAGYAVVVQDDELDVRRFEALAGRGRSQLAAGDAASASALLREGLALWRGPAYVELAEVPSAQAEAARLEQERLAVIELRFAADLALGRHAALVSELTQQVAVHPLRERLRVQLMSALQRDGRPAEALAVYREGRQVLAEELGLDPGPELVRAQQAILAGDVFELPAVRSEVSAGPPKPFTVELPEPVWTKPSLLPSDVGDFTGRDAELALAYRLLAGPGPSQPASALVVVGAAGMAGLGKTALAVHLGHRLAEEYPDGQLFVNLRGAEAAPVDPGEVLARFLRSMGVDSRAVPVGLVERAERYRSLLAGRRVLVVLDNAASEEQVRPLLPGASSCAVLITSRARLSGIESAQWLDLQEFVPEQAIALLTRMVGRQRVESEPPDAAAIVELCGYLPLAVRIAGARLTARPTWPLAHLADLLRDQRRRLDQLAVGDLEVRASLALSYTGLDPAGRRLFRLLGGFDAADFASWLAAAVLQTSIDVANRSVEALVDAQLLTSVGIDPSGQARYRFHDLVRLYARERAAIEDGAEVIADALASGLGGWLAIAEQMAPKVPGPCFALIHGSARRPPMGADYQKILALDPLSWFDAERPALQSAVRQAAQLGLHEFAFDLAGCLEKYFDVRGMYEDWQATNELAMAACQAAGNLRGEAVMLRGLIDVVTWNTASENETAMGRLHDEGTRLLQMFTRLDEPAGIADALVVCSWGLVARDEFGPALAAAQESLRVASACGHLGGQARAEVAIAVAYFQSLRLPEALTHLAQALNHARELGNPRYVAAVLQFLGIAYLGAEDLATSHRVLMESLAISRTYRDHYTETLSMTVLARLHFIRGDANARETAEAALVLGRQYGMKHHIADALTVLGDLELAAGKPGRAVDRLTEAVELWRTRGWPSYLAAGLESLGRAQAEIDAEAARQVWTEAREIFRGLSRDEKAGELTALIDGLPSAS